MALQGTDVLFRIACSLLKASSTRPLSPGEPLSGWSADGSLAATAEHVLDLDLQNAIDAADDLLQTYTSQWSLGQFESLPQIILLSNKNINAVRGAYSASTRNNLP